VRKVLGQRGAARTYLADDVDGLVVLKELSFFTEPDAATLAAFHQEARQLQSLTHPRIPRYLDMLQLGTGVGTRLYLSQEFVEGTSLEVELSRRRATELEARELARQVLDILHYLQGRSPPVFHGDLKPANLIRRSDDALFLVDFGAAWVRGETGVEASRYTRPDQRAGELDATTDFYALGVTLVDSLTWEPQWKQRAAAPEALASHVDVSPGFREFLARLLASERELRFTSAAEALRELEAPEHAPAAHAPPRRAWRVAVGVGAALLIFGAGFVTGRATQVAPPPLVKRTLPSPERPEPRPRPQPLPAPSAPAVPPVQAVTPATLATAPLTASATPEAPDMINSTYPVGAPTHLRQEPAPDHQSRDCEYAGFGIASASGNVLQSAAEDAFDHDLSTTWRSNPSMGAWLSVDLGQPRALNGLVLAAGWKTSSTARAPITVETSLDDVEWTPLITMSTLAQTPPVPYRAWFPRRVAQYVRFRTADWQRGEAFVSTFELYGPDCPLERTASRNIRDNQINPLRLTPTPAR
jgi:serine/threonine protein kinase